WFPKMFGVQLNEGLSKAHGWLSVIFITIVFTGQMVAGWAGHQRRLFDPYQYHFLEHLLPLNKGTSFFAFTLGAIQLIFVYNVIASIIRGRKAEANPWQVGTLEWEIPSPPPNYNYDPIPEVVRGPHEYANADAQRLLGRDWLSQTEVLPASASDASGEASAAG